MDADQRRKLTAIAAMLDAAVQGAGPVDAEWLDGVLYTAKHVAHEHPAASLLDPPPRVEHHPMDIEVEMRPTVSVAYVRGAAAVLETILADEPDASTAFAGDLLDQAQTLADDDEVHVAAPIVLAGAAVEQRLRALYNDLDGRPLGKRQGRGMVAYATRLRSGGHVASQVVKDVTTIGGNRDAAAHGDFDDLDRATARATVTLARLVLSRLDGIEGPAEDDESEQG